MEIPIEISFDSEKPKKRAPPARFAAMMKQKEQSMDPPKPVKEIQVDNCICLLLSLKHSGLQSSHNPESPLSG